MVCRQYGASLLCGGEGRRLRSLTGDTLPKPLIKIRGKELIRYSLDPLPTGAMEKLVFAVGYQEEVMIDWVQQAGLPFPFEFSRQAIAGVLPAILSSRERLSGIEMVACNADEVRHGLNLEAALAFHEVGNQLATVVAAPATDLYRYRVLDIDGNGIVTSTVLKGDVYRRHPQMHGIVNTGLFILSPEALDYADSRHSTDWSGLIDPLVQERQLRAFVDLDLAYFNVGTPEEYQEAEAYLDQHA